jgi:hypothetical protein
MNWELFNQKDLMGNEIIMNSIHSPKGTLSVRYRSDNGFSILYNSHIGDSRRYTIKHTIYREQFVRVKFDDKIVRFDITTAVNNDNVFFITEKYLFSDYLQRSKNIVIEYYTLDGTYQAPFNVEGYKNLHKPSTQQSNDDKKMLGIPDKYFGVAVVCSLIFLAIITKIL